MNKTLIQRLTQPINWFENYVANKAKHLPDYKLFPLGNTAIGRQVAKSLKEDDLPAEIELTQIDAIKVVSEVIEPLGHTAYGRKKADLLKKSELKPGVELIQIDAIKESYTLEQRMQKAKKIAKTELFLGITLSASISAVLGLTYNILNYRNNNNNKEIVAKPSQVKSNQNIYCTEQNQSNPCNALLNYNGNTYEILRDGNGLKLEKIK